MMDFAIWLKWVHIISATLLFGAGLGTAFQMWAAHLRGNIPALAVTTCNVVLADWLFTIPAGLIQPISGLLLVRHLGYDPFAPWLVATYVLYLLALICWLPVVWLQIKLRAIAGHAATTLSPLPEIYAVYMRIWFALGWPAFLALMGIFYLMVAKPNLW